jgi:hypothetical protein
VSLQPDTVPATKVTVYTVSVVPVAVKVWEGESVLLKAPSPKNQMEAAAPVLVLVNCTGSGEQPEAGSGTKEATGLASTVMVLLAVPEQ